MEPEKQREWQKKNMKVIAAKLTLKYDQDIIDYLNQKKSASDTIKKALRLLMEHEQKNINGGNDQ